MVGQKMARWSRGRALFSPRGNDAQGMSVDPPTEREAPRRQRLYALLTLAIVVGFVALASEVALQVRDLRRAAAAQEAWSRGHEAFRIHPFLQVSPRPNPSPGSA